LFNSKTLYNPMIFHKTTKFLNVAKLLACIV